MSSAFRLSIVANIALAGLVAVLLWRDQSPTISPLRSLVRPATARAEADDDGGPSVNRLQPKSGGAALTPAAVAELERMGMSRDAIADALIDDHTYRYDKRVRALEKKYAPKPVPRREMIEVARQGEAERIRELKESLGEEGYVAWDKENTLRMLNMGGVRMDPGEADKAYRLQKEFDQQNKALQMAMEDGVADQADTAALYEQAQKKLDGELEKLLGKDRLAALRGAPDPVAEATRRYEDLNPTPDQARAVLRAEGDLHAREAALVQRLKETPWAVVSVTGELKAMTDAREENLRQTFGAESYEATKQQNDPTYQKLKQYAETWNLKDNEIPAVYQTLNAFHDQADLTRMAAEMSQAAGQSVNWNDVNAGIEQARQKTEAGLANLIGGESVRRMKQNGLLDVR